MGMPYASSALRWPVQVVSMRNGLHLRGVIENLLRPGSPSKPLGEPGALVSHLQLPDALGIACQQAASRDDILSRAMELRARLTGLRESIHALRMAGATETEIVRRLQEALKGLSFARSADTTVAKLSSVATAAGVDLGTALLVAKLAQPLGLAERGAGFLNAIRKPHVRVLQRFDQLAMAAATTDDIGRLWKMSLSREWFQALTKLSDLTPYETVKLKRF